MDENQRPDWVGLFGLVVMGLTVFGMYLLAEAIVSLGMNQRLMTDDMRNFPFRQIRNFVIGMGGCVLLRMGAWILAWLFGGLKK